MFMLKVAKYGDCTNINDDIYSVEWNFAQYRSQLYNYIFIRFADVAMLVVVVYLTTLFQHLRLYV
jgi:hypothetical protein